MERFDDDDDLGRAGPMTSDRDVDPRAATAGDLGVLRARQRFGGIDLPASLAGMLAALGMTLLLGGILGAIGSVGYQFDLERDTDRLSAGGFIAGLVALVVAFLVGGWVAGRMARYDGGRNGIMTAVWFLVLTAVVGALGAWAGSEYDIFRDVAVPSWFSDGTATTAAVISAIVGIVLMFVAAWAGGLIGERYHRRADGTIAVQHRAELSGSAGIPGASSPGGAVRGSADSDLGGRTRRDEAPAFEAGDAPRADDAYEAGYEESFQAAASGQQGAPAPGQTGTRPSRRRRLR